MKNKTDSYIISIVGVVAIIAIAMMMTNNGTNKISSADPHRSLLGNVIASPIQLDQFNELPIDEIKDALNSGVLTTVYSATRPSAQTTSDCTWTKWLDRDDQSGSGDWEVREDFIPAVCDSPVAVQCQTVSERDWTQTGEEVICNPSDGAICQNALNPNGCSDYEVRFCCPNAPSISISSVKTTTNKEVYMNNKDVLDIKVILLDNEGNTIVPSTDLGVIVELFLIDPDGREYDGMRMEYNSEKGGYIHSTPVEVSSSSELGKYVLYAIATLDNHQVRSNDVTIIVDDDSVLPPTDCSSTSDSGGNEIVECNMLEGHSTTVFGYGVELLEINEDSPSIKLRFGDYTDIIRLHDTTTTENVDITLQSIFVKFDNDETTNSALIVFKKSLDNVALPIHMRGDENAEVTMVEWVDYNSPFVIKFENTIKDILQKYDDEVNLQVNFFPFDSLYKDSQEKAEAVECAGFQGDKYFWDAHDFFLSDETFDIEDLFEYTKDLSGFSYDSFINCVYNRDAKPIVDAFVKDAKYAGVTGVPTTDVVNVKTGESKRVHGAVTYAELEKTIKEMKNHEDDYNSYEIKEILNNADVNSELTNKQVNPELNGDNYCGDDRVCVATYFSEVSNPQNSDFTLKNTIRTTCHDTYNGHTNSYYIQSVCVDKDYLNSKGRKNVVNLLNEEAVNSQLTNKQVNPALNGNNFCDGTCIATYYYDVLNSEQADFSPINMKRTNCKETYQGDANSYYIQSVCVMPPLDEDHISAEEEKSISLLNEGYVTSISTDQNTDSTINGNIACGTDTCVAGYLSKSATAGSSDSSLRNTIRTRCSDFFGGNDNFYSLQYVCVPNKDEEDKKEIVFNLGSYPDEFLSKKGVLNTVFVVGEASDVTDTIGLADITASLQHETKIPFPPGVVQLDSEFDYGSDVNIISVGGSCANAVTHYAYDYPYDCTEADQKGVGKISLKVKDGRHIIIAHGYTGEDTRKATTVLANWKDYSSAFKNSDEVCVTGDSLSDLTVSSC